MKDFRLSLEFFWSEGRESQSKFISGGIQVKFGELQERYGSKVYLISLDFGRGCGKFSGMVEELFQKGLVN